MRKKTMILTMVAVMGTVLCTGCGAGVTTGGTGKAATPTEVTTEVVTETTETATEAMTETTEATIESDENYAIQHDYRIDETSGYEFLVIKGLLNNEVIWTYESEPCEVAQCCRAEIISSPSWRVYLNEGGVLKALDARTGEVVWENKDYNGGGSVSTVDENGVLYISGYDNPGLLVIDANGNTLKNIDSFEDYFWPISMELNDGKLTITFDSEDDAKATVDTSDFSYTTKQ